MLLGFAALFLGCVANWIVEGDVRLQLENRSEYAIARLNVIGEDSLSVVWVSDTLFPGEKSRVISGPWSGSFNLELSVRDSLTASGDTLWRQIYFPSKTLEGGSQIAQIAQKDGKWTLKIK